jgi:hypothetical protein
MATVINNPPSPTPGESDTNAWVGLVLMIFVLFLILYLGVPYLRNLNQPQVPVETNAPTEAQPTEQMMQPTTVPQPTNAESETDDTTILIPDKIDVNINQTSPSPTQ